MFEVELQDKEISPQQLPEQLPTITKNEKNSDSESSKKLI